MKLISTSLIVLFAGAVLAQKAPTEAKATENELKQIETNWTDAQKTRNVDKLRGILADGWVGIGWDGTTSDKAKALADLKSPGNSLDSVEMGTIVVRIFGNTAVVTGTDTEKSMEHGKDSSGKYVWTDVFVKQNSKWRAVASQSARVPD
jgi:uncharacterized protein DUF4440